MSIKFDEQYSINLRTAWEKFTNNIPWDYSFIRPEIYDSWVRSRNAGVNPVEPVSSVLNSEDLNICINANLDLIDVVHPYMEQLYDVVKDSGSYILLCDKDGYLLDVLGDADIIQQGKSHSMLVTGANRNESFAGTNGIGTCLYLKKPIQIWGEEHYLNQHKVYACSSAPFFDASGNILGCLDITLRQDKIHPHTLGMATSAADGITKELKIRAAYKDNQLISAQRNSIIQSMPSGVILLNSSYRIAQINKLALNMFHLKYEEVIGQSFFNFIRLDENMIPESEIYNKEINVSLLNSNLPPSKFNVSINIVTDDIGEKKGTVLIFSESKLIHKLVSNINGYQSKYTFDSIIGASTPLADTIRTAKSASQSSSNVLILGESGTGKELFAHAIHNESAYSQGPFVAVNCAALPRGLVESELFGYEKGAFTGANKDGNPGKFELADGGTIFLDEIGDVPLDVQVSLLRVIQTKEVVRIGGWYPKPINVRIIAATNKNLNTAIELKTFRSDLYYRLNVFTINVPTLSERVEDIRILADFFVQNFNRTKGRDVSISPEVYSLLLAYSWPGNIRELENVIERAVNITDTDTIQIEHLPQNISNIMLTQNRETLPELYTQREGDDNQNQPILNINQNTRQILIKALEKCNGNISDAATMLGINRRTLYRKIEKFGIQTDTYRTRL